MTCDTSHSKQLPLPKGHTAKVLFKGKTGVPQVRLVVRTIGIQCCLCSCISGTFHEKR